MNPVLTFSLDTAPPPLVFAQEIRDDLRRASEHNYAAATKLLIALRRRDWQALGYQYADQYITQEIGISTSYGYALVRVPELQAQFPDLAERLNALDMSKAMTIAAAFPQNRETREFNADAKSIAGLVEIAEKSSVRKLKQTIDDQESERHAQDNGHYPMIRCPHCNRMIELSRAANVINED